MNKLPVFIAIGCIFRPEYRWAFPLHLTSEAPELTKNDNRYFEWAKKPPKDILDYDNIDAVFYFDNGVKNLGLGVNHKVKKYGWLSESNFITRPTIDHIRMNYKRYESEYESIFTHDRRLLSLGKTMKFLENTSAVTSIKEGGIKNKTKLVSMISSDKNNCPGHRFRLSWVKRLKKNLDLYGRGFSQIKYKDTGLHDYMFSVAIENGSYNTYFSEKILDCFATGTIPIYHGSPDIGKHFDSNGIIILDKNFSIKSLSKKLYLSKMDSVRKNFEILKTHKQPEDLMYERYFLGKHDE